MLLASVPVGLQAVTVSQTVAYYAVGLAWVVRVCWSRGGLHAVSADACCLLLVFPSTFSRGVG